MKDKNEPGQKRQQVEAKLIKSACKLLAQRGPRAVSLRDIAQHAGVNHGQIHHYFGGKKGLLQAAMLRLAEEHAEHAKQRGLDELDRPPSLTLGDDKDYIVAVVRCVLDGELELATLEVGEDISVPRHVLERMTKASGRRKPTPEIKAALAKHMAIELAFATLEPYIFAMADVQPKEVKKVRSLIAALAQHPLDAID